MEHPRPVLTTGASTGIGKAVALALHARGFAVIAGVRGESDGVTLRREAGERLRRVLLDVTSQGSIARAVAAISAQTGGELYGPVNNAGDLSIHLHLASGDAAERSILGTHLARALRERGMVEHTVWLEETADPERGTRCRWR